MTKRVSELFDIIRNANAELEQIRSSCQHSKYYLGMWQWRVAAYNPSRICEDCQIAIPGITEEEVKQVNEDFYKGMVI